MEPTDTHNNTVDRKRIRLLIVFRYWEEKQNV